ncbi:MAG: J domain-containing protein [Acidobacteriia bacterium]|nr:J domain-containing protein [Terriglobia bacterium]
MRNRKSPLAYYRALGLQPGASAQDLRRAYLHLVKLWHPDRFQQYARKQAHAQEKLKEINEAYTFLKDYRPGEADLYWQQRPYPSGATAQWREYQRRREYRPPVADPYEGNYQYRPVGESRGNKFALVWVLIVVANLATFTTRSSSHKPPPPPPPSANVSQVIPLESSLGRSAVDVTLGGTAAQATVTAPQQPEYFSVGSSKADVYRIQGVPDWSSEKEWRYGQSRVYFRNGVVERWQNMAKSPLKIMAASPKD